MISSLSPFQCVGLYHIDRYIAICIYLHTFIFDKRSFGHEAGRKLVMECNREEALRAREIAEKKLSLQDYNGARKFLQKALQLFPALENTTQMSSVLDVHIAAQTKINGVETDWYGILQVDPRAEEIVIKKQYKKLALLLHPDKNKSLGAESAFKLIGEALQVLSDKQQRAIHDSRRKQVNKSSVSSAQRSQNRQPSGANLANKTSVTFMTICPACHTKYQYYRVYENQNLLCHQCHTPFIAREFHGGPSNGNGTTGYNAYTHQFAHDQQQSFNGTTFQSNTSDPNSSGKASDHMNNMSKENQYMDAAQGVKRKRSDEKEAEKERKRAEKEQQRKAKSDQKAQEAMERMMRKKKEEEDRKRRRQKKHLSDSSSDGDEETETSMDDLSDNGTANQEMDSNAAAVRRSSRLRRNVTYKIDVSDDDEDPSLNLKAEGEDKPSEEARKESGMKGNDAQNGDAVEMKEKQKLADFFKDRIRTNLNLHNDVKSSNTANGQHSDGGGNVSRSTKTNAKSNAREEESSGEFQEDFSKNEKKQAKASAEAKVNSLVDEDSKGEESEGSGSDSEDLKQYTVPDPEFHDFDKEREEKDVAAGQIWAAYDDDEGLPRYYFKVKEVKSMSPFRVTITWLELRNMNEQQRALKKLGYHPVCGASFRCSFSQVLETVDIFSHILKWEKGLKGLIRIYPRKGDIWALYRDWEPNLGIGKESASFKYEMVEVLSDFNADTGVSVACMEKFRRHKTVFMCTGSNLNIPAEEICRFSYQVPAYKLKGTEAPDLEGGFWELDPASVPSDLILPCPDSSS